MQLAQLKIRSATERDVPLILSFICKKAEFDRSIGAFSETIQISTEKLQNTLFSDTPFAHVLFAEIDTAAIGFALYYFRYSSFAAQPSLWLDDLYVEPHCRGQQIGTRLMQYLAEIAIDHHCTHLGWTAWIDNQQGVEFYRKLGAAIVDQKEKVLYFQASPISLQTAKQCTTPTTRQPLAFED